MAEERSSLKRTREQGDRVGKDTSSLKGKETFVDTFREK